jgi:hypothetical protein
MTRKSKLLMLLALVCGVGIGILSPLQDGMYSAMMLFLFPIVFALMAVAIGMDFKKESTVKRQVASRVKSRARRMPRPRLVRSHSIH